MMPELKPCPFCGGKAVLYGDVHSAFIECDYCGVFNGKHISAIGEAETDAIKAWNQRHNEVTPVDEVSSLDSQRRETA